MLRIYSLAWCFLVPFLSCYCTAVKLMNGSVLRYALKAKEKRVGLMRDTARLGLRNIFVEEVVDISLHG